MAKSSTNIISLHHSEVETLFTKTASFTNKKSMKWKPCEVLAKLHWAMARWWHPHHERRHSNGQIQLRKTNSKKAWHGQQSQVWILKTLEWLLTASTHRKHTNKLISMLQWRGWNFIHLEFNQICLLTLCVDPNCVKDLNSHVQHVQQGSEKTNVQNCGHLKNQGTMTSRQAMRHLSSIWECHLKLTWIHSKAL